MDCVDSYLGTYPDSFLFKEFFALGQDQLFSYTSELFLHFLELSENLAFRGQRLAVGIVFA